MSNETVDIVDYDIFRYSTTIIFVFGALGNILVILSVLRQKRMLKNSYYRLILQLAFCDLAVLTQYSIENCWPDEQLSVHNSHVINCRGFGFVHDNFFKFVAVGMMLIISLLRYRAIVYPSKPSISRRNLKIVCGLVYLVGLIAVCVLYLSLCFVTSNVVYNAHEKFRNVCAIVFVFFVPAAFMAVVYYRIGQSLIERNKYWQRVCSNSTRLCKLASSFKILRYSISEVDEIFLFVSALFFVTELEIFLQ